MNAMILAAGLGTRLKPWTLEHPKALAPVGGVPMLERVIGRLREEGFNRLVINIHHFGEQIIEFVRSKDLGVEILISDERGELLDTGGGLVRAGKLFGDGPVLIHNVDILSNADLRGLMERHEKSGADVSLLVSERESSRRLVFDGDMMLRGWHNVKEEIYRPSGFQPEEGMREYAFSGIYVVSPSAIDEMERLFGEARFPVMDYLLSEKRETKAMGVVAKDLRLIDIGKPDTLEAARLWVNEIESR